LSSDVLTCPASREAQVHRLAPGTELLGQYQDSGLQEPRYLVRRSDGQVMQLPTLLYRVASSLDGVRDDGRVASTVSREAGQDLTAEQVSFLVEERLRPAGIIGSNPDTAGDAAPAPAPAPVRSDVLLMMLKYRVGAVPASAVWRVAGFFLPFFRRPVWIAGLVVFVALDLAVLMRGDLPGRLLAGLEALFDSPELCLLVVGVVLISGVFHECGHVGACRYGGATPGDMGIGLYLVWPALYSTVTDAYRLNRVGRLRTDLGGVYFNAVFMAGIAALYLGTGQPWVLVALLALHTETAWQFVPSIRLDGYYILADLIGVPDLFSYLGPVFKSLRPGRPAHPSVRLLKPWPRRLIIAWVAVVAPVLVFWIGGFILILPRVLPYARATVHDYLASIHLAAAAGDIAGCALAVFNIVMVLLPWVGSALISWTFLQPLGRWIASRMRSRTGPRRIGGWMAAVPWAAVRRGAALAVLLGIGTLLVARVARVAESHPATTSEVRLSGSALAAVRGVSGAPSTGWDEVTIREQLAWYARLTGAFDRHATVVAAGRELAVVATAVLVACLVALVAARRIRPLAAALPLVVVLVVGPAVTVLASLRPEVVASAWIAVGLLLLGYARGRAMSLLGLLAVVLGLATQPLLAAPLAVGFGVLVATHVLRQRAGSSASPKHARRRPAASRYRLWLVPALVLPVIGLAVLVTGRGDLPLNGSERTVLLLLAGLVVASGLFVRRARPLAAGAACAVLLAALPWSGSSSALSLALVSVALLGALFTHAVTTGPVRSRPHPLLRGAVGIPVLVLMGVGSLFAPDTASPPPVAELAAWITSPASGGRSVDVPPELWGDLLRNGVPAERLHLIGSGTGADAVWTVDVGDPAPETHLSATLGSGATVITVQQRARAHE
jgi:putative peptide zinc metalloprotease protein